MTFGGLQKMSIEVVKKQMTLKKGIVTLKDGSKREATLNFMTGHLQEEGWENWGAVSIELTEDSYYKGKTYYINELTRWDEKICKKKAKSYKKDFCGAKDPEPGLLSGPSGLQKYNGGCCRPYGPNGKWYHGEIFPLPLIPEGYYFEYVLHWNYRLRVKEEKEASGK
jgi:hypothetical protein